MRTGAVLGEIRSLIAEADQLDAFAVVTNCPAIFAAVWSQKSPLVSPGKVTRPWRRRYVLDIEGDTPGVDFFLQRLSRFYCDLSRSWVPEEVIRLPLWAVRAKTLDGLDAEPICDWQPAVGVLVSEAEREGPTIVGVRFHEGILRVLDAAQRHLQDIADRVRAWETEAVADTDTASEAELAPGLTVAALEKLPQSQQKALWFAMVFRPDITRETNGWDQMKQADRLTALAKAGGRIDRDRLKDQSLWIPPWFRDEETFLQQMASEAGGIVTLETALRYLREGLNAIDPPDRVAPMHTVNRAEHVGRFD